MAQGNEHAALQLAEKIETILSPHVMGQGVTAAMMEVSSNKDRVFSTYILRAREELSTKGFSAEARSPYFEAAAKYVVRKNMGSHNTHRLLRLESEAVSAVPPVAAAFEM